MIRYKFITVFSILLLTHAIALGDITDTVLIQDVSVIAQKEKYLTGSKVENVDSLKLSSVSGESLTEVITTYLPIYVKQDAGGLATICFRGTSPNHTAIMFNGININSLTLGNSNLSNIPAFLFDDVKVQFGSSSSLFGSDAIGGSIHLNNKPEWNKGGKIGLQQDYGSFNSWFSGVKLSYSKQRFQYSLKMYRQNKENNFPFLNTAVKDFEKNEFVSDTMRNAAILNQGLLQEIYYKLSDNLFSYVNIWYEDNWHQIQPNMSANYYGWSNEEIKNRHLRVFSGLKYYAGLHKLQASMGYVNDYQMYNKNQDQIISTDSYTCNLNYSNSRFLTGELNTGINVQHIITDVYAYESDIKENRFDMYVSYLKSILPRLDLSLNMREAYVTDYKNQFSPSVGANFELIRSSNNSLNCKFSYSHSYKIPTFNDRYWPLVGNPDLLYENGVNYETNIDYLFKKGYSSLKVKVSAYLMDVDNWIIWVPVGGDIWKPSNKKKVDNRGGEIGIESNTQISSITIKSGINYSLTKAIEKEGYNEESTSVGRQLFYTPLHVGNAFLSVNHKKWTLLTSTSYTGERYTESYRTLDDYFLLNTSLGKSFKLNKNILSFSFKVNNVLDTSYQNQELYAMPGRNYAISIKYTLTTL